VGLWLQGNTLYTIALSRFASSYGKDADSWGADWGFLRNGALPSTGYVTFSRFTATNSTTILVGAQVQTQDKTQQFTVVADATNAAWNGSNGFIIPALVASVTLKMQSVNAAAAANVVAGAVNTMVTTISGIDYVNNALAFTGGADTETDASYKSRFPNFLLSLARGTSGAITAAIEAIQVGTQCNVLSNVNLDGTANPGHLTIIVDDGSGAPPPSFLAMASAQAALNVADGISWALSGPTIITINVSFTLVTASGYTHATLVANAQNAVVIFVDAIADGGSLSWSQLYQVIYNSSPGITDVLGLLINGSTADIVPASIYDVIKTGTVVGT